MTTWKLQQILNCETIIKSYLATIQRIWIGTIKAKVSPLELIPETLWTTPTAGARHSACRVNLLNFYPLLFATVLYFPQLFINFLKTPSWMLHVSITVSQRVSEWESEHDQNYMNNIFAVSVYGIELETIRKISIYSKRTTSNENPTWTLLRIISSLTTQN